MKQRVPVSVDDYLAAQPEATRRKLEQMRAAIRNAVPEAVEGIGYGMPGYKLHGKPLLYFAGFKEHCSLPAQQTHSGEAHQPNREAACGWYSRYGGKTSAKVNTLTARNRRRLSGGPGHLPLHWFPAQSGDFVLLDQAGLPRSNSPTG